MIQIDLTEMMTEYAPAIRKLLAANFPKAKITVNTGYQENHLYAFGLIDYRKVASTLAEFEIPFLIM